MKPHWVCGFVLAFSAQAADVRGQVAWSGVAPENIVVELGTFGDAFSRFRARVDGMGEFQLTGVPAGDYELRLADRHGFVLHRQQVSVRSGLDMLSLRVSPPRLQAPASGTISAAALAHKPPAKARKEFAKGERAAAKRDLAQAAAHFAKAAEIDPLYAAAFANVGACYAMQNRDAEALAQLEHALAVDPDLTPAHTNMSQLLLRMERYGEAEREARAALRQKPSSQSARRLLQLSLKMQGKS